MNSSVLNADNVFLKCSICSYPLSIIPIYNNSALGNICGRCDTREKFSEKIFDRQILFEIVAKNYIFPCAFKAQGCIAELKLDNAYNHEQVCLFKVTTVLCPLFHEKFHEWCTWIGEYAQLSEHIRNKHTTLFTDILTFTLTPEFLNKILFSEMNGNLLMVMFQKRTDNNSYICWIMSDMHFKQCLEHKFEICFSVENAEKVIFEGEKIEYISASTRICPEYNLAIPMTSISHLFEINHEITTSISIVPKGKLNLRIDDMLEMKESQKPSEVAELTTEILHELECPICTELMGTPIYMCREGHNMCFRCRHKISECPVCRGNILGGRNFTLEKLCSIVKGPCIYRKDGCSYIETIAKVKMHEPFCYLAMRSCVINICSWYGRTLELPEHLEEEHTFRDISQSYTYKIGQKPEQHMFLYDDKIFLMNLGSTEKKTLNYSIHCLGGKYLQYDYELELIHPHKETNKIILKEASQPIGYNFNNNTFLLQSIPIEMLKWLFDDDNEIKFRVNVHDISD